MKTIELYLLLILFFNIFATETSSPSSIDTINVDTTLSTIDSTNLDTTETTTILTIIFLELIPTKFLYFDFEMFLELYYQI